MHNSQKKKIDKLNFLKSQNFFAKDAVKKIKRKATAGIKYLPNTYKDPHAKFTKNSCNSTIREETI